MVLKTEAGYLKEALDNIYYFEPNPANSHQSMLYTTDNQVITINATLNELEKTFPVLFRTHRHYLINPLKVVSINLQHHVLYLKNNDQAYPFSRLRTTAILTRLKENEQSLKII